MAASYLEAVKAKLAQLNSLNNKGGGSKEKTEDREKQKFFKPDFGEYEIRILPYRDTNDQPFEEVLYYSNFQDNRILAPIQYQMEDPIHDWLLELEKGRKDKEVWLRWNKLRAKPRFYAVIMIRGQEKEGPMVWEFSPEVCEDIYKTITHKNFADEDFFSPETGYDLTLSVSPVPGKMFKGKPVKQFKLIANMKPSALGTKKQIETWIKAMPNLHEYFKKMVSKPEKLSNILENYMNADTQSTAPATPKSDKQKSLGTDHNASRGVTTTDKDVEDDLEKAFSDL